MTVATPKSDKNLLPTNAPTVSGAVPADPTVAVSLPPGSPGASVPVTTTAGALAAALPALPSITMTGPLTVQGVLVIGFGMAWFIFGIAGFIMSLVCMGYSGTAGEKIMGLVIALMLGPWYFLYYFSDAGYCKRLPPTLF